LPTGLVVRDIGGGSGHFWSSGYLGGSRTAPTYDPNVHHRRSVRLAGYDYSQCGAYFVTICAYNHKRLFGNIVNEKMQLNEIGVMVKHAWEYLPKKYPYVSIDEFVIMPNHFHGILIIIDDFDGSQTVSKRKSVGRLIGMFKTVTNKRFNETRYSSGGKMWQRNYYEHIIRDEEDYMRIFLYIQNNPLNWRNDTLWLA